MKDNHRIDYVHLPPTGQMPVVQKMDYPNPYDYKKLHRHDYFEIIIVQEGHGNQLIDLVNYNMIAGNIYIIYPGQVHIMHRDTANGLVLQFNKSAFEYMHPLKHHDFFTNSPLYNVDLDCFKHILDMAARMQRSKAGATSLQLHKSYNYLQIILISLLEAHHNRIDNTKESMLLSQFISLITDNIRSLKKVNEYADLMLCSTDKLNEACKTVLNKTALELIHEELMLEIRRLLLLNELSLKEIAYELNFDSQANFNAFVKSKTGFTPKEIQMSILEIYN